MIWEHNDGEVVSTAKTANKKGRFMFEIDEFLAATESNAHKLRLIDYGHHSSRCRYTKI